MEIKDATVALAALSQPHRLQIFRLLVQQGLAGLPAGHIGSRLKVAPATLSFHLSQLSHSGLITAARNGRQIIYAANYERMNCLMRFLTENCCGANERKCVTEDLCETAVVSS